MNTLLRVDDVSVDFPLRRQGLRPWARARTLSAVRQVSFSLDEGESLGVVGESGSGKTTLARAIIGTVSPTVGTISWNGKNLSAANHRLGGAVRGEMSMIFQNSLSALNPRMTAGDIISEPIWTHCPDMSSAQVAYRVDESMEQVGLNRVLANRYPHELSGGQCQRVGIARALVLKPKLIICDEPVAALDVSVRAQVVNLFRDLQRELHVSLIFITHDLGLIRHVTNRTLVMYLGRMVEMAPPEVLIRRPRHPYTHALVSSVPVPDPVIERKRVHVPLTGEIPSPVFPPPGCAFETRCPRALKSCKHRNPLMEHQAAGHEVACFNRLEDTDHGTA